MVNKYSLGGAILAIVLLALMGMRSAANWLASSNPKTTTQDSLVADNTSPTASDADNRLRSQPNGQPGVSGDQIISQAGDGTADSSPTSSALNEAGTYIQRQKSAEQDPLVAGTNVDVIPAADSSNVSAEGDTITQQQPTTSPPLTSTPAPASPAVPALW